MDGLTEVVDLLETFATAIGVLVVTVALIAFFAFGQSVREIEEKALRQVKESVGELVRGEILEFSQTSEKWENVKGNLASLESEVGDMRERLRVIDRFSDVFAMDVVDATGSRTEIDRIRGEAGGRPLNDSERMRIQNHFTVILKGGLRGQVAGNTLFNASQAASTVGMQFQALLLSTLASVSAPTSLHNIAMHRKRAELGLAYEVDREPNSQELSFRRLDYPAEEIQETALLYSLKAAASASIHQSELTYGELWNVGVELAENGALEKCRNVLLASYHARTGSLQSPERSALLAHAQEVEPLEFWNAETGKQVPSSLPLRICEFFQIIGDQGWRDSVAEYLDISMRLLEVESARCTWHSIRDDQLARIRGSLGRSVEGLG